MTRLSCRCCVESAEGEVRFFSASGAVGEKQELSPGGRVETGEKSSVAMVFSDGTRVDIGGKTALVNVLHLRAGGRELHLPEGGVLEAHVANLSSKRPTIFSTPEAEAIMTGTVLRRSRREQETRWEVREGTVRFRRLSDGAEVTVAAGQFAATSPELDLQVQPLVR